ncbi:AAA family ATPase [Candidatus Gracilibacteria bacterium]|nr:AAA family ATPase [Candidatus Gracilibacteria bacterium]
MITNILKIKNLGRLNIPVKDGDSEENKNDDFSFKRNTLIFGDNTYGKTTLVSVFKSLQSSELLDNRKTFKSQNAIQIKIKSNENNVDKFHEYGTGTWTNNNIIIFDNDFIKTHVFSEDEIKGEHLKSLPKILIGNGIKTDIDQINAIIKCDNGPCENCEFCLSDKLSQHKNTLNKNYQLDKFFSESTKIVEADKKIKEKEDILTIDEKLIELKAKSQTSDLYKIDIQAIEDLFDKRINSIFESIIESHLSEKTNNLDRAKGFLGYGLQLKKDNICPFCSQDTTNVKDFIDNLSSYFDSKYVNFKNDIDRFSKTFLSFDLEKELLIFDQLNFTLIKDSIDITIFQNALTKIRHKVERKKEDLNFDCDFKNDTDFNLIKDVFSRAKAILKKVIDSHALTNQDKIKLNQDVNNLKINKYRHSTEGVNFYNEHERLRQLNKNKNDEKVAEQETLRKKVNTFFEDNLQIINPFLKTLKADFRITKFTPSIDNRDKNNYLKVNEYLFEFIDIQGHSIEVETGKFKETFSDSDKRLLGFAFFLSTLKNDTNLKNKIIILDDPFSSFDINRKEETIKLFASIKNASNEEPIQKIVFTHEKSFYCQLNRLITSANSNDKKLLKLNYSKANNGTMFEVVDIKKFESDKYYGDLAYINNAVRTNQDLDEALPKARECAEYLLKAKYINTLENYRNNKGEPIDFNISSITTFLEAIDEKCSVKDILSRLDLHRFHHNQPQWKTDLSDTTKGETLKDFVDLIEKI